MMVYFYRKMERSKDIAVDPVCYPFRIYVITNNRKTVVKAESQ